MESLTRIQKQLQKTDMISQSSVIYKCRECCDTGWIETDKNCYKKCECIEIDFIRKCWKSYGVKPNEVKPLRDYITYNKACTNAKQIAVNFVDTFQQKVNLDNNWLAFLGQPGSGKSHIVIAVGAALLNREAKPVRALYMPYLEVMRELKANVFDNEKYIKLLNRYQRAEVLIIDDLFKDKVKKGKLAYDLSEADMKQIYPIINYRYFNKLPTIISSECTPNMLIELDEALAGRILERCDDKITVFQGQENNYRLRKFEKN